MSKNRLILLAIQFIADSLAVMAAWTLAYYLRFYTFIEVPKGIPSLTLYMKLLPFMVMIWFSIFVLSGFYQRTLQRRSAFLEGLDVIQNCVLVTLAFIAFTYFYEEYRYSRITLVIFAFLLPTLIITFRSLIRKLLRRIRRNRSARGVFIIGSGAVLRDALRLPQHLEFENTKVLGIVYLGALGQIDEARALANEKGVPFFQQPECWIKFFTHNPVETVVIAVAHADYSLLEANITQIAEQVPDVKIIPDVLRYSKFGAGISIEQGVPVVAIHQSPLEGVGGLFKRIIDFVAALLGIIVLSPLLVIVAILVKISSPGPVLYRQQRMGLDGKTFDCLKFRSMPVDAEKKSGPVWARAGEDRATWFGKFIRKYSIDELPQLFNVLKGDMSLVGPRPERPVFVHEFRTKIPGYMLRHKAKAGITGWAQVSGWRGNTSIEKRIEYDLYYIQNWSLWFDFQIILRTVREVFFSKNAY